MLNLEAVAKELGLDVAQLEAAVQAATAKAELLQGLSSAVVTALRAGLQVRRVRIEVQEIYDPESLQEGQEPILTGYTVAIFATAGRDELSQEIQVDLTEPEAVEPEASPRARGENAQIAEQIFAKVKALGWTLPAGAQKWPVPYAVRFVARMLREKVISESHPWVTWAKARSGIWERVKPVK